MGMCPRLKTPDVPSAVESPPPPLLANLTHSPRGLGRHCLLPSLWVPKSNPEEPSWKTPSANSAHLNQGGQVGRDPAARMFRVYRSHRNTLIRGKKIGFRSKGRSFNCIENILGFNYKNMRSTYKNSFLLRKRLDQLGVLEVKPLRL